MTHRLNYLIASIIGGGGNSMGMATEKMCRVCGGHGMCNLKVIKR